MTKNPIERPQTKEPNANKNTEQVKNEALANRNHGDTRAPK